MAQLQGKDLDFIHDDLFDYDRRLKWDPTLAGGKVIHEYEENVMLTCYYTAAAAGGAVSSRELVDIGLKGIECYYPEHKPAQIKQCLELVKEFDLVASGGSDFHGEMNPKIKLGVGFGGLNIPDELVELLEGKRP